MTTVNGQRIVRLRQYTDDTYLPPFGTEMWKVTDPDSTRALDMGTWPGGDPKRRFITRGSAAAAVTEKGWRYVGPQEDDRIQIISSDPRAKDLTLRVIGKWAEDNS